MFKEKKNLIESQRPPSCTSAAAAKQKKSVKFITEIDDDGKEPHNSESSSTSKDDRQSEPKEADYYSQKYESLKMIEPIRPDSDSDLSNISFDLTQAEMAALKK